MPLSTITNPFLDPAGAARSNVYSPSANTIGIVTAGTERVRVDSSGNVGIGTSPAAGAKLHVSTTSADAEVRCATTTANYSTFRLINSSRDYSMQIRTDQSNAWTLRDETAGANRLFVDTSGRVIKPFQPSFVAKFSGTAKDGSTISPVQFNTTSLNVGSCFNTSTYKFTAPVAGIYSFTAMPCYKETSNDFSWGFSINGGSVVSDNVRVLGSTPNSHSSWTGSLIVNLAANDTVEVKFTAGTYHQNGSSLNYFSGILIG